MDAFVGLLALSLSVFSSFPLIRRVFADEDVLTLVVISFVVGLSCVLLPLFLIGILLGSGFVAASWAIFLSCSVPLLAWFLPKVRCANVFQFSKKLGETLRNRDKSHLNYFFVVVLVMFFLKFSYILSIKGIFDWDAIDMYLPFARRIFMVDHIPLVGYDYQPMVYPPGISVLYAWSYSLGGSPFNESFRLFPLIFEAVIIVIIYKMTLDLSSRQVAKVAVLVFTILPLHDAILYYCSYYPDLCYNSLILATFFFIYAYMKRQKTRYCLLGGLSLGLSALMKPQFLLWVPATMFVFIILLKNRRLQQAVTYVLSGLVGFFFVFVVWTDRSFILNMPVTTLIPASVFALSMVVSVAILISKAKTVSMADSVSKRVLRDILLSFGVFGIVALVWYLRNYLFTGSILWSIGFQSPSYQWASAFLQSTTTSIPSGNIGSFLTLLISLPFTIFALGTTLIIPKLSGLILCAKRREGLIMIIWVIAYWISYFWWNFANYWGYLVNPRDLFVLAPFFSIFSALGIAKISSFFTRKHGDFLIIFITLSFGLTTLFQSMLIGNYGPSLVNNVLAFLAKLVGCSLESLSWRTPNDQLSLLSSTPSVLFFVLVVNVLIFGLGLKLILSLARREISPRWKPRVFFNALLGKAVILLLVCVILLMPYLWLTFEFTGGNVQSFGKSQLEPLYGGLYTKVASFLNDHAKDGNIILTTDVAFRSLQYYLHGNVQVVALNAAGNLAAFREVIECNNLSDTAKLLLELHVRYFLEPSGTSPFLEKLSHATLLLNVVHDPRFFKLVENFPAWSIYELVAGESLVIKGWEENSFQMNWTYNEEYSTPEADWSLSSDGDVATFTVAGNAKAYFRYLGMPSLNTTEFPYMAAGVKGSPNARWLFRLYTTNGTSYDFPYWAKPSEGWETYVFMIDKTPLRNELLNQEVFLAVESVDSNPATLSIDFYMIFKYVARA